MAVWPSQRNQASQGLLNRGFRPSSVEHLFGSGACPGREPRWRAVPLRLGSRGHSQVWWQSQMHPQSGS
jgi:hypothetical protein